MDEKISRFKIHLRLFGKRQIHVSSSGPFSGSVLFKASEGNYVYGEYYMDDSIYKKWSYDFHFISIYNKDLIELQNINKKAYKLELLHYLNRNMGGKFVINGLSE